MSDSVSLDKYFTTDLNFCSQFFAWFDSNTILVYNNFIKQFRNYK